MPLTPTQEELTRIIATLGLEVRIVAKRQPPYRCAWRVTPIRSLGDWRFAATLSEAADAATHALRQWAEGDSGVQTKLASWRDVTAVEPENPRLTSDALGEAVRPAQTAQIVNTGSPSWLIHLRDQIEAVPLSTLSEQQQLYNRYAQGGYTHSEIRGAVSQQYLTPNIVDPPRRTVDRSGLAEWERELLDPDNYAQGDF